MSKKIFKNKKFIGIKQERREDIFFHREEREGTRRKAKAGERRRETGKSKRRKNKNWMAKKFFCCSVFHGDTLKQSYPTTDVIGFYCPAFYCLLSPGSFLHFYLFPLSFNVLNPFISLFNKI